MSATRRSVPLLALACALACALALGLAARAAASTNQFAMIEEDSLIQSSPASTLAQMRALGAQVVRVFLPWGQVTPGGAQFTKPAFDATDPYAYLQDQFAIFDNIDRIAAADGIAVDFVLTGPGPNWAGGPGAVNEGIPIGAWMPSPAEYREFVDAVGHRYNGHFFPVGDHRALPRVRYWELWNEPNFGYDLGPQARNGSRVLVAPEVYRELLNAGWSGLHISGHGGDVIVIGQLAARGLSGGPTASHPAGLPGIGGQTKPMIYIRALYCVGHNYKPLTGAAAAAVDGCSRSGNRAAFRRQNPALFNSSGFAIHPYAEGRAQPPTQDPSHDPDYVSFNKIPNMESALDKIMGTYGSHRKFPIYNNEYGYITNPPNHSQHFASPALAGVYINEAEYLSWKDPRIANTMQYRLQDGDPRYAPEFGGFATGLINSVFLGGKPKANFDAYRMPIWVPSTRGRKNKPVEIWGSVRPAVFARADTHQLQKAHIQWAPGNSSKFRTLRSVTIRDAHGYIDVFQVLPGSGTVRIVWSYPTREAASLASAFSYDPAIAHKLTINSAGVKVTIR